jgi:hypothetical protein
MKLKLCVLMCNRKEKKHKSVVHVKCVEGERRRRLDAIADFCVPLIMLQFCCVYRSSYNISYFRLLLTQRAEAE